jgi:hypothetical protein
MHLPSMHTQTILQSVDVSQPRFSAEKKVFQVFSK